MRSVFKNTVLIGLVIVAGWQQAVACNLSDVSLDSVTVSGPNFRIYFTACFGAGRTGVTAGADNDTRTFAFGFYSAGPLNIVSFTPASVTSNFTACNQPGFDVGPQGPPFGTQATLGYLDMGCGNAFTCITSTALCGNVNQECFNFMVELDAMPDSMRVFGVEGSGNPVAGCSFNTDQLIDFTSPLPVTWDYCMANYKGERTVEIKWGCSSQLNNDYFTVQRYNPEQHYWTDIYTLDGAGNSNVLTNYTFLDIDPINGVSYYRIMQTDFNGQQSYSKIVSVNVEMENVVFYPMPFYDEFTLFTGLNQPVSARIQVLTNVGVVVRDWDIKSLYKSTIIDLQGLPSGVYILRYETRQVSFSKRIIKY